ncbi:MAG: helix-turn-helix transcriptional regulator [Bacillota bacterium]
MPLKNNLKVYRKRMKINQSELGKKIGVSRQTISSIERGKYNPSVVLALKIAKVFDTSVEEIFSYKEEKNE